MSFGLLKLHKYVKFHHFLQLTGVQRIGPVSGTANWLKEISEMITSFSREKSGTIID